MNVALPCFLRPNSKAVPNELAVQLPRLPWSYTPGQPFVRLTFAGTAFITLSGAAYMMSRASGRSGSQPILNDFFAARFFVAMTLLVVRGCLGTEPCPHGQ